MSRIQRDLDRRQHASPADGNMIMRRTLAKGSKPRICIIGAGVAGLRAADVLLQHGAKVTILEARNRIGGRLAQSDQLGPLVDLGPNWLHGTKGNPIMELAKKTNTQTHFWEERQVVFGEDGKALPGHIVSEASEAFWSIIADAFKYSNEHSNSIPSDRSLMDFIEEKAEEKYGSPESKEARLNKKMLLKEAEMWGAFVGGSTRRQSLKFFWLEECLDGENPFVAGTFQKILNEIARPVLSTTNVEFEHHVTQIESTEGEKLSTRVFCKNGYSDVFDEVIVTTPLGWLKRNQDAFKPALPHRFISAINSLGYGNLDKVYLTFPRAFWNTSTDKHVSTLKGDAHQTTPNITATTKPVHHAPSDESIDASQYPGFVSFSDQQAINLASLSPAEYAHPTLLFYIFGPCAEHIASLVTTTKSPETLTAALTRFFEPYFSLLPNYDPADADCTPSGALATAWTADEFAGYGSYTNFQVGLEEGDRDVEVLREGCPERGLWFAGEHTSPFVALGTVTGGYFSGEDVARRVLHVYGLQDEEHVVDKGRE